MAMAAKRCCGCGLLLWVLVALVCVGCPVSVSGEMRKSWQLKAEGRTEEPGPSAKPPEAIEEVSEVRGAADQRPDPEPVTLTSHLPSPPLPASDFTNLDSTTAAVGSSTTAPASPEEPVVRKASAQFSSRVRSKPVGSPVVVAVTTEEPLAQDRAVPLHLEHRMDEIQVDDATVQDDDDDDGEDGDDDVWHGVDGHPTGQQNRTELDLIENLLEEIDERAKEQQQHQGQAAPHVDEPVKKYTFPPVLNMTIDEPNSVVSVKLNHELVRDILHTGRAEGGGIGGKKMLRYVLPLFILPFLIQSAVIPFMLTAVKLFLLKSLMAGKLAIFLLLLGAFKNFTKKDRDVYVKDLPDRRYEPSSEGFAYLSEGRPSNWVN
ncbi:uncharacterized protein LOC128270387 [Anopheles cruzii]|uniref:uncharacterized protein LOC128270387 n=1 Tax=Anopheles cruzii TaxID=68878 RepID=UPI0022EC5378|nr:uncharacterized protein LOC128270387 [Anopheles cruzii]